MASVSIIKTSEIPPKETKWSAVAVLLRVLAEGHTITVEIKDPEKWQSDDRAIRSMARRLGFKVSIIRRSRKKFYVTRLAN